jgi:ferric-dicitrate binding protein FerR (iron transport regulator)
VNEIPDFEVLLSAYVTDECTQAERAVVERWLAESPEAQASFERLARARTSIRAAEPVIDSERVVAAVLERVRAPLSWKVRTLSADGVPSVMLARKARPFGMQTLQAWMWGTAALGVALVAGWILAVHSDRGSHTEQFRPRTYVTGVGQRAVITLGDGTQVTLAPQTTLQISKFGPYERMVTLNGEGYFDVSQSAKAPFLVRTGSILARVLGTAFWVRRYANDPRVRVAVFTGKVAVTAQTPQRPTITLAAGMVGEVTNTSAATLAAGDLTQYGSWLRDQLVFRDTPMPEVLATLERWYGYHFVLADSALAQGNLTAVLSTESTIDMFSSLELLLGVDLAVNGKIVTLKPRGRRSQMYHTPQQFFPTHESEVGR